MCIFHEYTICHDTKLDGVIIFSCLSGWQLTFDCAAFFPHFFFFFWFDKFDISILPGFQFNAICGGTLWSGGATFLALSFNEWMNEPVFSTRGANASQNVFKRVADHYIEYGSRQRISQWKFRVNLKVPSDFQTCNWHTESGHSMQFSHTKLMIP